MSEIAPAKIVSQKSHVISGKLKVTEHFFDVPKNYSKPDGGTLRVFARSVRKNETPIVPGTSKDKQQLPWICYLAGGPGCGCKSPQEYSYSYRIIDKGYQLLFLDQRGTGLSTPITASTLAMRGTEEVQTNYVKLFRQDNIVRDCEAIRKALTEDYPDEKKKWSIMGQSFGGACSLTYLSFYPEGLRESFIFGGLPTIGKGPHQESKRVFRKVIQRNEAYYNKYPEDIERVKTIHNYLKRFGDGKIKLPSGGALTRRRFSILGFKFGFSGGLDDVHDLVLHASVDIELFGHLTRTSLSAIDKATTFDNEILGFILGRGSDSDDPWGWSHDRMISDFPVFDLDKTDDSPIYFRTAIIEVHMFEDFVELPKLEGVVRHMGKNSEWPKMYDEEQLAKNEVPVYAAVYVDDMYVEFDLSMETAKKVKGCKVFATNVMFHNAIESNGDEVFKQLWALRDDTIN